MKFTPYGRHYIDSSDIKSILGVIRNDNITGGKKVSEFENKVNSYLKCKFSVACNSGTSALFLAFQALKVKKNDVILMPSVNFVASYNAAKLLNAKVYFTDVDPDTGQMKPEHVEECCKKFKLKKIKAILIMYNGGYPENAEKFYKFKKKFNCSIIEDACHAFGASYKFKNKMFKIGSCKHADISTFSFHPLKTITTAEGGIVTTNSKKIFNSLKLLRSLGLDRRKYHWKYDIKNYGLNFRLNELQSALGISQLKKINLFISKRKKIYQLYRKELKNIPGLSFPNYSKKYFSSYHLCLMKINTSKFKYKEQFIRYMLKNKIMIQFHYIPIYKFSIIKKKTKMVGAEQYFNSVVSLPIFYHLSKIKQYEIIKCIKNFFLKNL